MTHQHRTGSIRLGLLASAIATLIGPLTPEAHAQRALGDGRVLDNNPRVGSGGRNTQRQSFQRELEFRNAIATGNAPGGLSFRGDIGYRAPGEFRGELGSDALFAFRRDSLYSGLAGMGIRGTDALQYQFSMTTGSRVTNNLIGSSSYTRLGRVTTSADAATRTLDTRAGSPFRSRELGIDGDTRDTRAADTESALSGAYTTGTLRSTSAYRSTGSLNPEILSTYEQGIGRDKYAVVSSPLTGLTTTPLEDEQSTNDRARRSLDQRVPTSYDESAERALERAKALRDEALGREPDPGSDTERDAEDDAETSDWMRGKFLDLQRQLQGVEDPEESESDADADGSEDDAAGGPTVPPTKIRFTDRIDPTDNTTFTIDPETLEIIRANDEEITYLINPEAETRDIYTEHMRAGEDLLSAGRYFDAEERFTSALSIRSGDVPAQLGRLHAQIGAGLVMSGSLNLRSLLSQHPEIAAQRYDGDLLPGPDRLDDITTNLRERVGLKGDLSGTGRVPEPDRVRLASALLLAYIGYQRDQPGQIRDGLGVVSELGDPDDLRFAHLLRRIWLDEDESAGDTGRRQPAPDPRP